MLNNRYRIRKMLGMGAHGIVFKAEDTLQAGRMVAIKSLCHAESFPCDEIAALAMLQHKDIPRLYEVFMEDDIWHIVMQYIEGVPRGIRGG